jgi:hypothetical protein
MATAGTWIYESGSTSGGGTSPGIPSAPPVTITGSRVDEKENGIFEVQVMWQASPLALSTNFLGAQVYLEDPDISNLLLAPLDGSVKLDGTSQSSGAWKPIYETDSFESPATVTIPGKPADRPIRVYLLGFGPSKNSTLVRANRTGATPSIRIDIPAAAGSYVSGQEYAWLVTNAAVTTVEDFDNPAGPRYHLVFDYLKPDPSIPLPPGLNPFGGVQIVYEYDDGTRAQATFLQVDRPDTWVSDDYDVGANLHFKVWFPSVDVAGNVNSIVAGVTPVVDVNIIYPPAGQATAPDVTGFALSNFRHEAQPDGTIWAKIDATWTNPTSPRYAGVAIYRVGVDPAVLFGQFPIPVNKTTLEVNNYPTISTAWEIAAIAYDFNGKLSADPKLALPPHVPTANWVIGPPGLGGSGQEYAPNGGVSGVTITTEQVLNSDGVVMMRHHISGWTNPTNNTFGGMSIERVTTGGTANPTIWDAAKGATSFDTPWEPAPSATSWDFYFVSRDMQGHRNSILSGLTPRVTVSFTPMAGNVQASRLPSGWWDPSEFAWPSYPSGQFQANQFVAQKIFVGSILRVGGGSGTNAASFAGQQNGQIAVYNASNVLRAWMGEHDATGTPDNPSGHSIFGGWFGELYLGGDGPVHAPIYATQSGVVRVGGFEFTSGQPYAPYISILRNDGIEVGRIGSRIARNTDGSSLVPAGDPADIGGAWFREFSCGGQSLADWRVLSRRDATNPTTGSDLFNIRNVNKFTIDYVQNYPSGSNPTNAAMHLEFGYDTFVSDNSSSSYWKFPGFSITRTGTSHAALFINRGMVLNGPSGNRLGGLFTWNGDQFGSDSPSFFWAQLALYSPTSGQPNVVLVSGSSSGNTGASSLTMSDEFGTTNFSVDTRGNVNIRGGLTMGTLNAGAINCTSVNASGVLFGNNLQVNTSIAGSSLNVGSGRVDCGTVGCSQVTCTGNAAFNGNVTCDQSHANQYSIGSTVVINGSGEFVGEAVYIPGYAVTAAGFNPNISGTQYFGVSSTSFTTADGKTVQVRGGIIVSVA